MQLIKIFTFLFLFFAFTQNVFASDSYTSPAPIQSKVLQAQYSGCCSYEDNYKYWQQMIRLPLGTTLDRIQFAAQVTTGTTHPVYISLMQDNGDAFDSCSTSACDSTDTDLGLIYSGTATEINDTTTESGSFTPVTITQSNQYIRIYFSPAGYTFTLDQSVFYDDGVASVCSPGTYGATTCPSNNKSGYGVSFRVCNGACTSTGFNGVPNLTADAWARMISPADSSTQPYSTNFNFQFNWGTTTDNAIIRFNSAYQSIIPEYVTANLSGLQTETFTRNFPAIDDDLEIAIEMLNGSTSVFISPTYTIKLRDISQLESDLQNPSPSACDNLIVGALCSIATFLFIPSETPIQTFTSVLDTLDSKKPFSYFSQTTDVISSVASSSTSGEFVNLEVTINLPPVSGTYPILTKDTLDSIYDADTRLMVRDVIGYGLWIIFALTVIYMLLNIFNRAVYLGEQGNEKQSFSNRTKTIHER